MCEYKFRDEEICREEALPNSKYCILHIDLPEDEESDEFKILNKLKMEKVKEKVDRGDFNLEGAKLLEIDFFEMEIEIEGDVNFYDVVIIRNASFDGAQIGGDALFNKAEICGNAWFDHLEIKGKLSFSDAIFEKPEAQEESCRKAKRVWEKFGDRIEVDYYFYREMEAKRKQKYLKFSLK